VISPAEWLQGGAIGLASGVLSGLFGIGGGIITTPAIRLLMGAPALVAVGTPLPVILPSALTGAIAYRRRGIADVNAGLICGVAGALSAVTGAWATRFVGGSVVLLGTAAIIVWAAGDMLLQTLRPPRQSAEESRWDASEAGVARADLRARDGEPGEHGTPVRAGALALIGLLTGLYSGFFGLGGGFVLVPLLTRWLRFPIKRAIGTSLVAVAVLAVPGTITHALLGHIDWAIAIALTVGVIPGAALGARINAGAADRAIRIGFFVVLVVTAMWLAASELAGVLG